MAKSTGITRERDRKLAPLPRGGAIGGPGATPPYKPGPVGRGDGSTNPPGTFRPPKGLRDPDRPYRGPGLGGSLLFGTKPGTGPGGSIKRIRNGEIPAPGEIPGTGGREPRPGGQRYTDRGGQVPAKIRQQYREQGMNVPRAERMYYRSIAPKPGQERSGFPKPTEIPIGLFKPKPGLRDPDKPYRGPGLGGSLLFGTKPGTGPRGSIKRLPGGRNGEIPAPGPTPEKVAAVARRRGRFGNIAPPKK